MRKLGVVLAALAVLGAGCSGQGREGGGGGPSGQRLAVVAPTDPDGIANLVDATQGAVVNIDTVVRRQRPSFRGFEQYFGSGGQALEMRGVGSGFVVRQDGLIVTNYHVVKGANELTVTLYDGHVYKGKVMASDPVTDLALVRIPAKNLPTLPLADEGQMRVGEYVVAMGSPLGLQHTVSLGILSALNRDISLNERVGFLQTDAPINPGNSGGPLLNLKGEVVGVNTAIAAEAQGIGFAIPVGTLKRVMTQLERTGHVAHPWLGVGIANLPEDTSQIPDAPSTGVLVGRVESGSPAAKAGLRPGDVIVAINGEPIDDAAELVRRVEAQGVGADVSLGVSRDGRTRTYRLRLGNMPPSVASNQ